MIRLVFTAALTALTVSLSAQSLIGKWKTIDDEIEGRVKSIVEITEEDQNPICDKCEDDRKDQPALGVEIVRDMVPVAGKLEWEDGTICDPKNGRIYDCKMWFEEGEPDVLKVRGYWGFLYRTQEWIRQ